MKLASLLGAFLAMAVCAAAAIEIGDSYDKVIAELGTPAGKLEAGPTMVLRYPECTVRLKDGLVTAIERKRGAAPSANASTPSTKAKHDSASSNDIVPRWITDFESALAAGRDLNRNVFVFFTGSDWCGWCKRLKGEVLDQQEFIRYADENLVLVVIDFPRTWQQTPELKAQNEQLARKYKIRGFPTVLVFGPDGKQRGKLGYLPGGPSPFVERLKAL